MIALGRMRASEHALAKNAYLRVSRPPGGQPLFATEGGKRVLSVRPTWWPSNWWPLKGPNVDPNGMPAISKDENGFWMVDFPDRSPRRYIRLFAACGYFDEVLGFGAARVAFAMTHKCVRGKWVRR